MMKNFYEFVKNASVLNLRDEAKDTHVYYLRERYYSHLTFIDYLAKSFGDMNFWKQMSLYTFAIVMSSTGIFLINPFFFIIGAVCLNLLVFMTLQYRALEMRFSQLVYGLEESEKHLRVMMAQNQLLQDKFRQAFFKGESCLEELEEGRTEIQKATEKIQERKQGIQEIFDLIGQSALKSYQILEMINKGEADIAQKGEQYIEKIGHISEIIAKELENLDAASEITMDSKLAELDEYLLELDNYISQLPQPERH